MLNSVLVGYHFKLALVRFRRNPALTTLIVGAIALGVATTMTAYTVLFVMSRDPIPEKSANLFVVQIDNGGPTTRAAGSDEPPTQLAYQDAIALVREHRAVRENVSYSIALTVTPEDARLQSFSADGRATSRDFFEMFAVPMLFGRAWGGSEDSNSAQVAVLSKRLNERLFGGANSVGKVIHLGDANYEIAGVMDDWDPKPRFYDVIGGTEFDEGQDVYIPFNTAITRKLPVSGGYVYCDAGPAGEGFDALLRSECVWTQVWVELATAEDAKFYKEFLASYAREQQNAGRFNWEPNVRLVDVKAWLVARKVVPDDARISVLVAAGFLVVCLLNAVALMLAKLRGRLGELGVHRALGARRSDIFLQCLAESSIIGLMGGAVGLALTGAALFLMRALFSGEMSRVAHMGSSIALMTAALAVFATIATGVYPALRASAVAPALQLKTG